MIARVLRAVQRWILRSVCEAGYEMVGQEMPLPPDPGTRDVRADAEYHAVATLLRLGIAIGDMRKRLDRMQADYDGLAESLRVLCPRHTGAIPLAALRDLPD